MIYKNFINKLRHSSFTTLETTPLHEPVFDNIIEALKSKNFLHKIDGFTATDNPLSRLKYSSLLASIKLRQNFDKPVIATMTMRDRNKLALQSDLLGANDFDICSFLCLTGDPAKISDQPNTKAVLEGNSSLLLQMIYSFNNGMDYSGRMFKTAPKPIYPFSVINSHAKNFKTLEKKMLQKIRYGSVGIITQPVFDIENAKKLHKSFYAMSSLFDDSRATSQLVLGVFAITRLRTAQFLCSHVPGINVPMSWIDKLSLASKIGQDEEYKVGLELSVNLYKQIKKFHDKTHIMSADNFDIAQILLDA
jgi:5,10-methylenetetrahydrofolate reductase